MSIRRNYTVYKKRRINADGTPVDPPEKGERVWGQDKHKVHLRQGAGIGSDIVEEEEDNQEVLPGVEMLLAPEKPDESPQVRLPKYPPVHGGLHWVKPSSWGQIVSQPLVLVAFPEQWLPGRPETTLKDLTLSPEGITVRMENGSKVVVENLMSVRVPGQRKHLAKRSLHMG